MMLICVMVCICKISFIVGVLLLQCFCWNVLYKHMHGENVALTVRWLDWWRLLTIALLLTKIWHMPRWCICWYLT